MSSVAEPGPRVSRRLVEWRASRIEDPVRKLRYLRRAMDGERERRRGRPLWRAALLAGIALAALPLPTVSDGVPTPRELHLAPPKPQFQTEPKAPEVWLVEKARGHELYSNGLRIETRYEVDNVARLYPAFDRDTLEFVAWRTEPVGIVYHTTESQQAPFAPDYAPRLRRVGKWLLEYVRRKQAYHYVIDRFGRVHRVVRESDSANHAGFSVWADEQYVYVNLNPSFIGVAFEAGTEVSAEGPEVNPAQVRAAAMLTELLRSRYGIAARNCVAHAQVSVFSRAMRVGNHVDWAAKLPFGELGLTDNYGIPNPAIAVFGFRYGPEYVKATGTDLWKGLVLGENLFRQAAAFRGLPVRDYRRLRQKRYREILEMVKQLSEGEHG